jgi:hypothetical protein
MVIMVRKMKGKSVSRFNLYNVRLHLTYPAWGKHRQEVTWPPCVTGMQYAYRTVYLGSSSWSESYSIAYDYLADVYADELVKQT